MPKLAKGALVRLDTAKCFTTEQGGQRRFPLTNHYNDKQGIVEASRPVTGEETAAWYEEKYQATIDAKAKGEDTFSINFDDGGESRLPPQSKLVPIHRDRTYQVLRARTRVRLGWDNPTGGLTKILCTHTGEEVYVKREFLEVVG